MSQAYPYNAHLSRWENVSDGLAIVAVSPDGEPFPFQAGQYATLGLLGHEGKVILRPMSISSPSTDLSEYEFFIRHVPEGNFTALLWDITVGDPIFIKGAKGKFLLQDDGKRCLFVASGTGLAPFMSMIETLLANGESREIHLLHGVSHAYDLAWREWLNEIAAEGLLPLHYAGTISRPAGQSRVGWPHRAGRGRDRSGDGPAGPDPGRHDALLVRQSGHDRGRRGHRRGPRLSARAGPQGTVLAQGAAARAADHPARARGTGAVSEVGDPFYLTTAIFYPSPAPALHSLFEAIGADALVRYQRLMGDDVRFLTGMDEHSANVERAATERGVEPRDLVDPWAATWRAGVRRFGISYDRFIRTTDADHARASTEMVRRAQASGDIYKGTYSGWYCPGDNEFKTEAQLVDGQCPDHPTLELQWLEEENWFFRLSRYQERLEQLYRDNPSFCEPEHFRNEVLGWLRDGLRDFSISRAGTEWGIPFPDDPDHRIYVWFDALTNYITGAGFPDDPDAFAKWWPADVHVIGKNITRFHCLYWPAMLMSAGLPLPTPGLRPRLHARQGRQDVARRAATCSIPTRWPT